MNPVDVGEALLAAIGVRPVISHAIEQITPAQWNTAATISQKCDDFAVQLVDSKLATMTYNDFDRIDYSATLRDLSTPYLPAQVEAMMMHIPVTLPNVSTAFAPLAQKTFQYLYSQFPILLRESVAGNNNIAPPRSLMNRFECLLWLLDNPLGVFNLIAGATLTTHQLDGFRAIYPTLYQYIVDDSIPDAIENKRIEKPKFQFTRQTEQGVRKFFGRLPLPPGLNQILQTPAATPPPNQQPIPKANGTLAMDSATMPQRIEQGRP